ncbi:MAG TPA: RNA polymerase sigma factor [Polyangiaceae bacterium]|nr:RNA polymerase sigma factor [Polyangiaceae bacterium]
MTTSRPSRPWLQAVSTGSVQGGRSDAELIEAVVTGNDRVTAELYGRLIGVVDKSLFRVFGRREVDHDDLVQTAFEQVVLTLARGSYEGNCSLKTWAARISVNVGLNALRSRRRERSVVDHNVEFPLESPSGLDVERQSDARAALRVVMAELADMNPRRAEAVLLHDIQGYDLAEVATMTSVSVTAAQSRLVRGRRELLKRLDSHGRKGGWAGSAGRALQSLFGSKRAQSEASELPDSAQSAQVDRAQRAAVALVARGPSARDESSGADGSGLESE